MSFHQIPLRDWFAGLYMQGQVSHREPTCLPQLDAIADDAYSMADAMMLRMLKTSPVGDSEETP